MPRPGGPGPRVHEKSKDFKGSMLRLIKNLRPWKYIMGMALALAMISAILALVAPNKLSDFADIIGEGLIPKTEVLQEIGEEINNNLGELGQQNLALCFGMVPSVEADSQIAKDACVYLENTLRDIEYNNVLISVDDQIEMLKLSTQMGDETGTENALGLMEELPMPIYDLVKPEIDMDAVFDLAIFMGVLYLVSALFNYIQSFSLTTVSNRFANKLRDSISKKINKLPLKYFDSHETGDVLSRVTNDVDTVAQNLNNSLATIVTSVTLFIVSNAHTIHTHTYPKLPINPIIGCIIPDKN